MIKLMKYDIKKMMRILVYIYVVSLGLAIITRLINIGKDIQAIAIIGHVFAGLTYSAVGSIIVNTFVHILKVFTVGFYRDESYLTHTLPVKKEKLLLSKYLSSIIVIITSVVVSALSLFIVLYSESLFKFIKQSLEMVVSGFNMSVGGFLTLMVLILFSQICAMMSMAFAAIVKANTYNHKRIMKGLIWFAVFYFGSSIATLITAVIVFAIGGNLSELLASQMSNGSFMTILILGLVLYFVYAIVFYIITDKLFKKGVNVD